MKKIFIFMLMGFIVLLLTGCTSADRKDLKKSNQEALDLKVSTDKIENDYYLEGIKDKVVINDTVICTSKIDTDDAVYYNTRIVIFNSDEYADRQYWKKYVYNKDKNEKMDYECGKPGDDILGFKYESCSVKDNQMEMIAFSDFNKSSETYEEKKEELTKSYILENWSNSFTTCKEY